MTDWRKAVARSATLALCVTISASCLISQASAQAPPAEPQPETVTQALWRGDYDGARSMAMRYDDVPALLGRAQIATLDGDLEAATRFAQAALARASDARQRADATAALGAALIERGEWAQAEALLRERLVAQPEAHEVRSRLGELLWRQGRVKEAQPILDAFTSLFNDGRLKGHDQLWAGRALQRLGRYDDANFAIRRATEAEPHNPEAQVAWGHLFLEKYNISAAKASFDAALKLNPRHPGALIGAALVETMTSSQADGARALLDRAAHIAPHDPDLLLTRAHIAISDADCDQARALAATVLKRRPKHAQAFAIQAACHYLDDDLPAFEEVKARALALNPLDAQLLVTTAEYGIRAHRYVEALSLYRDALKLVPDHSGALLGLGIGLSRVGREDEALDVLRQAFDVDNYNVRAYNMVELYEKIMPRYDFSQFEGFTLRSHEDQSALVDLLVAPVVSAAMAAFNLKYDFSPDPSYLAVEVYPDPATFSVRSVGMPHISPHGICFGRVVTVRSPSDGNFNWRQVVWHELAHVYHLQLSKSRVPRWFTEGLAEYETNVHDPGWDRHHDREIAVKLLRDEIPSVTKFDRGFTHARSHAEILRAYHLASLSLHYIVQTHGFDAIVAMLRAWGERLDTVEVLQRVLKTDVAGFDRGFVTWLKRRYINFYGQLMPDWEVLPTRSELERKLTRNRLDVDAWVALAITHMRAGDEARAEQAVQRALEINPERPQVQLAALSLRVAQGRARDALTHGEALISKGHESYEIRLQLGRIALALEDIPSARVHLVAATQLYEDGDEAWALLATLGRNLKDDALLKRATRRLYALNQHDAALAKQVYQRAVTERDERTAYEAARRWLDISPFEPASQEAMARSALARGAHADARAAYEALALLRPEQAAQQLSLGAKALEDAGAKDEAQALRARASKLRR